MSLKRLLAQSIIWRGFYFFSILLVNVFLSRYLQASVTGSIYFIILVFSFIQILVSLSGESGIVYFAAGNIIQRNKLMSLVGCWSFVGGLLSVLFVYLFFLVDSSFNQSLVTSYCICAFLYITGQLFANYSLAVYYTKEDYVMPNFLLGLVNIIYVLIIPSKNSVPDAAKQQLITYLFFASFFSGGLLVYFYYIFRNRRDGAFGFPDAKNFKLFLRYSITALAANIIFFLVYKIDYAFVKYSPVCTDADLGNYIQVAKLGQMLLVIPQIIASVVFPKTATGIERMRINNAILVMARIFSQLFFIALLIVAITGNWLFIKVFGESFNKMQLPMLVLIPGIFALSVLALVSAYFSGKGKLKINLHGAIIALIVMIIGDFIFVPRYGIVAAACISTLSYVANLAYSLVYFYKDYSISWLQFIGWRRNDYDFLFSMLKKKFA